MVVIVVTPGLVVVVVPPGPVVVVVPPGPVVVGVAPVSVNTLSAACSSSVCPGLAKQSTRTSTSFEMSAGGAVTVKLPVAGLPSKLAPGLTPKPLLKLPYKRNTRPSGPSATAGHPVAVKLIEVPTGPCLGRNRRHCQHAEADRDQGCRQRATKLDCKTLPPHRLSPRG